MVGHAPLERIIGVRIPVGQPIKFMNKFERDLGANWLIAIEAAVLGFFVSIAGNACYNILDLGFTAKRLCILMCFAALSIFFAGLLMFMIENTKLLREKDTTSFKIIKLYISSWF
jgi:hypothetical protein